LIDETAVAALRVASRQLSPAYTARLLETLVPEGLRQDTLIFYLKKAVPEIPLKALLDAQAWSAVGPGSITDDQFDEMLRPWWPVPGSDAAEKDT
jgi:hypothetical protein